MGFPAGAVLVELVRRGGSRVRSPHRGVTSGWHTGIFLPSFSVMFRDRVVFVVHYFFEARNLAQCIGSHVELLA